MKRLLFLFVISLTLLLTSTGIPQNTIHVPADYSSIQEAINAAANGDLVLVAEGLYYENINFKGKAITIASYYLIDSLESHVQNTIINGSQPSHPDSGAVVTFNSGEDTTSILCGFTISGGTGTFIGLFNARMGGGICVCYSSATIKNNKIELNTLNFNDNAYGGGIGANSHNVDHYIIENNLIQNNSINTPVVTDYSIGGGIYTLTDGSCRIINNKIIGNSITAPIAYGGGIEPANFGNADYLIANNIISGNQVNAAFGGSGGLDVYSNNPVLKNNLIVNNSAPKGGGMFIEDGIPVLINNTIADNTSTVSGGGLEIIGLTPQIMNCIIWGNSAPSGPQINGTSDVSYSDIEGGYTGTGNIDTDPLFDGSEFYLLGVNSPCIDSGNPDPTYNDVEDISNPGNPLLPAQGALRNDMGHLGGPVSIWGYWNWPMPVELTSFTAIPNGKEVILSWSTVSELNNLGFEVQRSSEGEEFLTVGFVRGCGTSSEQHNYTFSDGDLNNGKYCYRLKQVDFKGSFEYSDVIEVELRAFNSYHLDQNYPNPFNPTTTFGFSIPVKSNVKITILNAIGEEVAVILNEIKEAGYHYIQLNASNLPSGVYFYQLKAGSFVQTKKMILLR